MDQQNKPGLARGLLRIHKAITRGLTIGIERGQLFKQEGYPDRDIQKGYSQYLFSLGSVLSAHHLSEDDVAFPAFSLKIPDAPYGRLAADHKIVEKAVSAILSALPDLADRESTELLDPVLDKLGMIQSIWKTHIEIEETYFSESGLDAAMTIDEQGNLTAAMSKYAQDHTGSPFLSIPFVLYNLEPDERAAMSATLPPVMIQEMIPIQWKDLWAPMKPFLLE